MTAKKKREAVFVAVWIVMLTVVWLLGAMTWTLIPATVVFSIANLAVRVATDWTGG